MPPQKRIFRQDILQAAVEVVRQQGEQALSVRSIANKLQSSTQPIYSEFQGIEQLKKVLLVYAKENFLHINAISYKDYGIRFLQFAYTEPELFRFLYIRRRTMEETFVDDINYEETISLLCKTLDMERDKATEMHHKMQCYCYALAVMLATGYCTFSMKDIEERLTQFYIILLRHYKQVTDEQELKELIKRTLDTHIGKEEDYGKKVEESL